MQGIANNSQPGLLTGASTIGPMAATSFCALPQQTLPQTSHIQAPSKTHCSIKVKPKATQSRTTLYCDRSMFFGNSPVARSQGHELCPQVHLCPTSRGIGQSGAGSSPLQGNDPSFHLTIPSMMEKFSVKKNPTKNLEEGYSALKHLSTLGLGG